MTVPSHIFNDVEVKLGRLAPDPTYKHVNLADYLTYKLLPDAPASVDYSTKVTDWMMEDNDKLGNCTAAAAAHALMVWTSQNGDLYTPTAEETDLLYWLTGTPPSTTGTAGGSTDTGRMCSDILTYWKTTGWTEQNDKIAAFARVNQANQNEVKQAVNLFGTLYLGVALPITAQGQTSWKVEPMAGENGQPGSWGGHCVTAVCYSSKGVTVVTWGTLLTMTWSFWKKYVDEAWVIFSDDWVTGAKAAPNGFNFDALQSDFNSLQ